MSDSMQNSFRALADPTRRDILVMLSKEDMTIGEIAAEFPITRAAVKKHLVMLEQGQLISVYPQGRERINRLEPAGLKNVCEWISYFDEFWDDKLSALQKLLNHQ